MGNGSGEHEDKGLGICDPDQLSWSPMLIFQSNSHRHELQMGLPLSRQLLYDLLGSKDFSGEFHRFTLSVIMTLTYGKRLESKMSREVKAFTQLEHDIAGALAHPMSALGDAFPILNGLPRWAAPWKRMGDTIFDSTDKFFQE